MISVLSLDDISQLSTLSPRDEAVRGHLQALVERLRVRDRVVIERLLRELLPRVRQWMFRQLGPHSELDDAVQDAMSEIASALHRFEGRSSVSTLARTIVVRSAYRYFARRSDSEIDATTDIDLSEVDPERISSARQQLVQLYRILDELPAQRRSAFVLCEIEGMTPKEAAEVEGCSSLAMRSRLFHARAEVESRLRESEVSS